jgi:hypothetical protein
MNRLPDTFVADLLRRLPDMVKDSPTNNEQLVQNLYMSHIGTCPVSGTEAEYKGNLKSQVSFSETCRPFQGSESKDTSLKCPDTRQGLPPVTIYDGNICGEVPMRLMRMAEEIAYWFEQNGRRKDWKLGPIQKRKD